MPGQYMTETVCARGLRVLKKVREQDDDDALDTLSWEFDEVARLVAREAMEDAQPELARKVAALEAELQRAREVLDNTRSRHDEMRLERDSWMARAEKAEEIIRSGGRTVSCALCNETTRERDEARAELAKVRGER